MRPENLIPLEDLSLSEQQPVLRRTLGKVFRYEAKPTALPCQPSEFDSRIFPCLSVYHEWQRQFWIWGFPVSINYWPVGNEWNPFFCSTVFWEWCAAYRDLIWLLFYNLEILSITHWPIGIYVAETYFVKENSENEALTPGGFFPQQSYMYIGEQQSFFYGRERIPR
jgi:hypothetical protein